MFVVGCKKGEDTTSSKNLLGGGNSDDVKIITLDGGYDMSSKNISYYESEALKDSDAKIKESDEDFVVSDYGPKDKLPESMRKPTIYVAFNHPVIPLSKLGEVMKSSNIFKITPEIKGTYRFYGTRLLSFEPDDEVLPQREYVISINRDIKSLGGKSITGETSFAFKTEELRIVSYTPNQYDTPIKESKEIRLVFSYPVNINLIKKYLTVKSKEKNYNFDIKEPSKDEQITEDVRKRTVILTIGENFPENSEVTITLLKGAKSEEGYLGTENDKNFTFGTLKPFKYISYNNYSYDFYGDDNSQTNPVYLTFSHTLDKDSVLNAISVSLPNIDIKQHIDIYDKTIKISNLQVSYNSSYNINLKGSIKDLNGRSLGRDQRVSIFVPDAYSYYYFPNQGDKMLESQYPPKIAFELQNIYDGDWKIGAIENPYKSFELTELESYDFSSYQKNTKYIEVIDLKPYLNKSSKGYVGISWNFATRDSEYRYKYDLNVQVTDIGISLRYGYNKFDMMLASLKSGEPIANAKVKIKSYGRIVKESKSDKNGFASFELKEGEFSKIFYNDYNRYSERPRILVEYGDDKVEFAPNESHNVYQYGVYSTYSPNEIEKEKAETFIFVDRGLYKPGETVTFRGIDKILKLGKYTTYKGGYTIYAKDEEYNSKPFWTEKGKVSENGGFYGSFKIPESASPGYYAITYERSEKKDDYYGQTIYYQVANFRRANFQVNMETPDVTYYKDDTINISLNASYLSGGVMGSASYDYYWIKSATYFRPKGSNWSSYKFGSYDYQSDENLSSGNGKLGGNGSATLKQNATGLFKKGLTYSYSSFANVTDIDRQVISASKSIVVHPANMYLGMKFRSNDGYWSPFVTKGSSVTVDYALVKPDGSEYAPKSFNKLNVKLYRAEWKLAQQKGVYDRVNTIYQKEEILESEQSINLNSYSGSFSIKAEKSGEYILRAETKDSKERISYTEFTFYSTGSDWVRWGGENAEGINLMVEKSGYKVGETARIMLQSPLPKGKYLVTVEREGIFEEKIYDFSGSANFIEVQVKEQYVPVFYVAVTSYSSRSEDPPKKYGDPDLGKPKGYFGITTVNVSTDTKKIELAITSDKKSYRPGEEAEYTILATRNGKPLPNSEITFLAVDRGVLDLINYHIPDPIDFFYSSYKFPLGVYGADSRSLLIDPVLYEKKNLFGGDDGSKAPEERKNFSPTAIFKPFLTTDKDGVAKVKFKLPDTLTTYRVTALAINDDNYGLKESETMVKNPINVRMALPRKLRLRDTTFAGVVVTNLDSETHEVTVKIESDLLTIDGDSEKKVKMPPNSICEIPFKILALKEGVANISFTTKAAVLNEVLKEKIVIEKPINKETFATIGTITDKFQEEGVVIPTNVTPNWGGLTIALDSTRINTLGESFNYLYDYPYLCVEQRSSKFFPLVVFKDTVKNFIKIDNVKKSVETELIEWSKYQNSDGGFPSWFEGSRVSDIFVSIKVAKFLHYAKLNNFTIPNKLNIRSLLDFIGNYNYQNLWEENYCKPYSYYVRSLHGDNVTVLAKNYLDSKNNQVGISEISLLGLTFLNNGQTSLAEECFKKVENLIKVGTQSVDIVETYGGSYYFNSEVSKIALFLMLYSSFKNDNDMITRITNTLLAKQKSGYWGNTYTTEWVIEAFYKLYQKEGQEKTNFVSKIKLNEKDLFEATFKGINNTQVVKTFDFNNELKDFPKNKTLPLNISKDGNGILFYTASLKYSLPSEVIKARDEGFSVFSEITNLDGKVVDGKNLKLGSTYKMRVVLNSSKSRNFVAVRCPIPSGAEVLDASLVTTQAIVPVIDNNEGYGDNNYYDDYGYGYDYDYYETGPVKKIYDNEVQYFFDDFYSGKEEIEFIFRVTTPGIYPTPPVYVECMYEEEVFGRNSGKIYFVNPK